MQDALTFVYVMSEHQADIKRYNLGRGAFASSISLLATLNLLAKIHYVLEKGESKIVGEEQLKSYEAVKAMIQNSSDVEWSKVNQYIRKPRSGDINETEAFIFFIKKCPVDFGLPQDDPNEARRIWTQFRNKLTHLIALANDVSAGQMLMGITILPSRPGMYELNLNFIKDRIGEYKPFEIPHEKTKSAFRDKADIPPDMKQQIVSDTCHVERLAVAVDLTIDWLLRNIELGKYDEANLLAVSKWLNQELTPTNQM